MAARLRRHLSFANAMSVIAVFIALGGAAYAVTKAPKNSVVSSSIRNGQVKKKDLGKDAVTGAKVKESSLGQVPSAATADRATSAASADSATTANTAEISGKRFNYINMPATDPVISQSAEGPHLLASAGGVRLGASCALVGGSNPEAILSVTTPVASALYSTRTLETTGDNTSDLTAQFHNDIVAGSSYAANEAFLVTPGTSTTDATALYRSDQQSLVITSHVEVAKPAGTCTISGVVTRAG